MLHCSPNHIKFTTQQFSRNLTISNEQAFTVLYKIKTNRKEEIDVDPNFGFIRGESKVCCLVKCLAKVKMEAKLQIVYSEIRHQPTTFEQEWSKLGEKDFHFLVVKITYKDFGLPSIVEQDKEAHTRRSKSLYKIGSTISVNTKPQKRKSEEPLKGSASFSTHNRDLVEKLLESRKSNDHQKNQNAKLVRYSFIKATTASNNREKIERNHKKFKIEEIKPKYWAYL